MFALKAVNIRNGKMVSIYARNPKFQAEYVIGQETVGRSLYPLYGHKVMAHCSFGMPFDKLLLVKIDKKDLRQRAYSARGSYNTVYDVTGSFDFNDPYPLETIFSSGHLLFKRCVPVEILKIVSPSYQAIYFDNGQWDLIQDAIKRHSCPKNKS